MVLAASKHKLLASPRTKRRKRVRLASPRLSVVIVNYYRWENTAALVKQLLTSQTMRCQNGEVLIVDNHSPAHPMTRKLRRCRGVSLRRWGRNRGFARAVNEGYRLSQGEWVLLLNPDMSLPEGFLDQVAALAEQVSLHEPKTGIIGLGLQNSDGSRQLSVGAFPSFWSTLARLLLPRSRRKYCAVPQKEPCRVDWVTGCCMLIRRDCLKQLGGLDPDYFLYYEDVDFCRRARENGWQVWYMPHIEAIHHHPLHSRPVSPALRVITRHSLLTYARKHWSNWQFHLLANIVRVEAWTRKLWAKQRGERPAKKLFAELAKLARRMSQGRDAAARRCVQRLTQNRCFYEAE